MSIITEIIVWASPVAFAGFLWLANELYQSIKSDIGEVKKDTGLLKVEVSGMKVQQTNTDQKVTALCGRIDSVRTMVHEIDKRTANVQELNGTISKLSSRLDQSDKNYGKILMILDGVAKRIGINVKKSGTDTN